MNMVEVESRLPLAGGVLLIYALSGCTGTARSPRPLDEPPTAPPSFQLEPISSDRAGFLDRAFEDLRTRYSLATIAAGVIKSAELQWAGYYGFAREGKSAGPSTLFNVASMTKPITAEVIVRLVARGAIDLDESMAPHWVDPDVETDPRHRILTPRVALTHRTGFPNWRRQNEDGVLRFTRAPDTEYGYSGEGYDYVARFAEKKLGRDFEDLVRTTVFEPLGMHDASISPRPWVRERIAHPVDGTGAFQTPYCSANGVDCTEDGTWSAADDLAIGLPDYARFLRGVMLGSALSPELQHARFQIHTSTANDPVIRCPFEEPTKCPTAQGFGLGWEIFEFGDQKIISHSGGDWSERAIGYFYADSKDGVLVFLNGPDAIPAVIEAMRLLDPVSPLATLWAGWWAVFSQKPS